jgi:pimeloyl-ACP methyl ester carboxylesterase
MVDFVKNYINTNLKNEKFIILGHSMGGGITQVICKMFKKQITSVILECPLNLGAALSEYESDFKQLIQSDANIATLKKEINADVKKITIAKKSIKNTAPVV